MYGLYKKSTAGGIERFLFVKEVSLFGCNAGCIPRLLRRQTSAGQTEPYRWHIEVETALAAENQANHSLVIDLKPNNKKRSLSFYEIADVWGNSDSGWSPIMMRLRAIFIDHDPHGINDKDFERATIQIDDPIFSMMYLNGSVKDGQLVGTWTAPPSSPTNSVLLWPETLDYFISVSRGLT